MVKNFVRMYEPSHLKFYLTMSPPVRCSPNYPTTHSTIIPSQSYEISFQSSSIIPYSDLVKSMCANLWQPCLVTLALLWKNGKIWKVCLKVVTEIANICGRALFNDLKYTPSLFRWQIWMSEKDQKVEKTPKKNWNGKMHLASAKKALKKFSICSAESHIEF